MPIKRNYNNAHERMEDKAEKAVIPMLEKQFIYQLGLSPRLMMNYDSDNQVCKVGVVFPRQNTFFSLSYNEHRCNISYPGYTVEEMSALVERVANTVVGNLHDTAITYGTKDIKRYAKDSYAPCIADEDTFLTWVDQIRVPLTPKDQLLAYYAEHKHEVRRVIEDEGYLTPFPAILYTFSEDEIRDMSDTTLEYIIRVVNDIRKLHQAN